MSFVLALMLQMASPPRPVEIWEPWLSWGCVVREARGKPFVVNGVVARRNEPDHPVDFKRHERALRVLRDDSGAFAGLQARSPLFVVRPDEFWAVFYPANAGAAGSPRSLTLKVKQAGGPGSLELFTGKPGSKPYATGSCATRLHPPKAES